MIGTNRPPRALIAAASRKKLQRGRVSKAGEEWQERLWEIYEHLGPVHYGVGFKRNAASKVTYFVAEQSEGQDEPVETDNDAAREQFDRLGAVEELIGELVIHKNVAGEGYLVGREREEGETWDVWSTQEVNQAQQPRGQKDPDAVGELREDDFVLRIWNPSPYKHEMPDSPLRSVQQQCEQLLLLNEQIGSVAMSRLSAGILLVPDELTFARPAEDPPDTGANMDEDPLMAEIIDISVNPINDGESAARVAPAVIRGASEYLKEIRHLTFGREIDKTFAEMREELLRQIAAGLDLPAEILTGLADLNHWSLWGIDESMAKLHVDPDVLGVLSGLTRGYLWPALEEAGVQDPTRYMVWRDYSDLTSRPLSIDQAMKMYDDQVITADHLRQIANVAAIEEEVGPSDIARRAEAVGVLFRAGFAAPAILEALGVPAIEHTGVAPVTVRSEKEVDEEVESPAGPDNVDRGPPVVAAQAISLGDFAEIDQTLAAQIIEASEAAAHRALERAGAKARAKVRKDRQLTALIDGLDNTVVTQTLGAKRLEQFQLTEDQLIPSDTFDPLADRLRKLIRGGQEKVRSKLAQLIDRPVEFPEEDEDRELAISSFIAALIAAVSARLFTSSPSPDPAEEGEFNEEVATSEMVVKLLTGAGGLHVEEFTPETPRGLALGQNTRSALIDAGYVFDSETWVWAYWRDPVSPYEPHLNLNGTNVLSREDPRLGGYWPGDHRFCTCEFVPSVLPLES